MHEPHTCKKRKKERKKEKEIKNSESVRSLGPFSAYVIAQK